MLEIELTEAAETLAGKLYAAYRRRLDDGVDADLAGRFGSAETVWRELLPEWKKPAVVSACWELKQADILNCCALDNQPDEIELTPKAIIYGDQAKARSRARAKEAISWIRSLLPF